MTINDSSLINISIDTNDLLEGNENIELQNIDYQIDVFSNNNGEICSWVKIDIEVQDLLSEIERRYKDVNEISFNVSLSNLPIKLKESLVKENANEQQLSFINSLFEEQYNQKIN